MNSPICSTSEMLVVLHAVGCVAERIGPSSVDQGWLSEFQFYMQLINLLSLFLRYNGLAGIQKALVDQSGSKPPNSDQNPFLGASLALGSALELLLS